MKEVLSRIDIIAILIQVIIGFLLPVFKSFLLSENQFQEGIKFLKDTKIEDLCRTTFTLFDKAINDNAPLRGEAGAHPDLIFIHSNKIIETCLEIIRLKRVYRMIEYHFTYLITTFILGVVFLLLKLFIPSIGYILSLLSIMIIISQILIALSLRRYSVKIKNFENL
jgi:hypothetical protein